MPKSNFKTTAARSANMARIRSKDTKPELLVRRTLHKLGFRFRLHVSNLPGHPDIVLPKHCKIIEVRGCFWHGHTCADGHIPKSNRDYWAPKLARNIQRDQSNIRKLRRLGWSVSCIWECDVFRRDKKQLEKLLRGIMSKSRTKNR